MEPLRHGLAPLQASLDLGTALGGITGDFGVNFGDPVAFKTVADSVFELRDLDTDPRPLARREPLYPHVARMRDIEGFVMVVFVVTVEGRVRDIGIVASQPAGVFDQAVIDAVSRWRFEPGARQGETVAVRVRQRLVFQLE